jgi:formyl-CoA transferase/CoA:oxalate CoA-transferase
LGATIWKVEHPNGGDETRVMEPIVGEFSHYFAALNRNKSSLAIDLSSEEGRSLALGLAERADIVIENFRPGVAKRLGIGEEQIHERNPRVVYCSISGFGQTGAEAHRPAYDVAIQAMSGVMAITGEPDGPPVRAGVPIADLVAGMMADIAILSRLYEREQTGVGGTVDLSMLDVMTTMLSYIASRYFSTGTYPGRQGTGHAGAVPYGAYQAADGKLVLATIAEGYWPKLCEVLGLTSIRDDERYATNALRTQRRDEVNAIITARLSTNTVAYWDQLLTAANIPCAPIRDVGEALNNPQIKGRGMVVDMEWTGAGKIPTLASPFTLSGHEKPAPLTPPTLGQDSGRILKEVLGLDDAAIAQLIANGAIATAKKP